jgi:hypothetical protein
MVRDECILWAGESPIDDGTQLGGAVAKLLGGVVVPRWPRPRVFAAIGPAQAQVKHLRGLPPVPDARVIAKLVQESPGRFFLKNGVPLAMTGVRLADKGSAWGGALDEPVVRTIADACLRNKFILGGIVPTVLVLGKSLEDERVVWRDGDIAAELTLRGGSLVAIRRLPMGIERDAAIPTPRAALRILGEEAWRFADAYAAAITRDDESVAVHPGRTAAHETPRVPPLRLAAAIVAVAVGAVAAMLAPGFSATRATRSAERSLRALGPTRAVVMRAESNLRRVSAALDEASAFETGRRSPTVFLSQLADVLPPTAQLVAVRLDSTGGNIVALALRAGDVLSRIERMDDIEAPEIIGAVTREYVGQQEKERVTIRFQWQRMARGVTR